MAHVQRTGSPQRRSSPAHLRTDPVRVTAWFGWLLFVGIVLVGAGVVNVVQGLVALFDPEFYLATASHLAIDINYSVWGWALLILGAALLVAGGGVIVGYAWARVVGVLVAAVNAVVNLGFVASYPMWTVMAVTFDVLTIYALVVHGGEGRAVRDGRG
jgi:hypothetical protein